MCAWCTEEAFLPDFLHILMRTLYNFQKILRHFSSLHVLCHQGDLLLNDLNNGVHTYTLFYPHSQVDTLKQYVCNEIHSDNSCWMFVYNGSLNNWRISLMKLSTLIRKFCCLTYVMRTTNVVSPPQSIKFRAGIKAYFLYHLKNVRFYEYGNHFVEIITHNATPFLRSTLWHIFSCNIHGDIEHI